MSFIHASFSKKLSLIALVVVSIFVAGCKADSGSAENSETQTGQEQAAPSSTDAGSNDGVKTTLSVDDKEEIAKRFAASRPDLVVVDVQATPAEGVYQVSFDGKGEVYMLDSGEFFFVGDLYQLEEGRIVNVSEESKNGPRKELLAKVSNDDMIIFSPEGEVKASVVVFTDVDCGYCRKLHNEVPRMNELGIEVKYMAYPRAGVGSGSYNKIASAWCAEDPRDALTKLKSGETIPTNVCDGNPVAKQFDIGRKAGLSGTPAIVLEDGQLLPGYLPAERLAQTLGI